MTQLEMAREEIDRIDREMAQLFEQRMAAVSRVIAYKIENKLPILDTGRERAVIEQNLNHINDAHMRPYFERFLVAQMAVSKDYQQEILQRGGAEK